ncbi:MAG TPA: hypothetical protein VGD42_00930 [Lysobacter sp.]
MASYSWHEGQDGTHYCINPANGAVVGFVQSVGNGSDIFKIGMGVDFTHFYQGLAHAKAAVEATARALGLVAESKSASRKGGSMSGRKAIKQTSTRKAR